MILDWLTKDGKRKFEDQQDFVVLVKTDIDEITEKLEKTQTDTYQNSECLSELSEKLDIVIEHIHKHDKANKQLLETFYFNKKLKKWIVGLGAGITFMLTLWLQGNHFFEEMQKWISQIK